MGSRSGKRVNATFREVQCNAHYEYYKFIYWTSLNVNVDDLNKITMVYSFEMMRLNFTFLRSFREK